MILEGPFMEVAGVSKVSGDLVLGRSLHGLNPHYIASSEETLKQTLSAHIPAGAMITF
jgi:hypothetical protein